MRSRLAIDALLGLALALLALAATPACAPTAPPSAAQARREGALPPVSVAIPAAPAKPALSSPPAPPCTPADPDAGAPPAAIAPDVLSRLRARRGDLFQIGQGLYRSVCERWVLSPAPGSADRVVLSAETQCSEALSVDARLDGDRLVLLEVGAHDLVRGSGFGRRLPACAEPSCGDPIAPRPDGALDVGGRALHPSLEACEAARDRGERQRPAWGTDLIADRLVPHAEVNDLVSALIGASRFFRRVDGGRCETWSVDLVRRFDGPGASGAVRFEARERGRRVTRSYALDVGACGGATLRGPEERFDPPLSPPPKVIGLVRRGAFRLEGAGVARFAEERWYLDKAACSAARETTPEGRLDLTP